MIPNFIIAGGVATGTSFLSAALAEHPEIYLPVSQRPEPNFFHYSSKFSRGMDWYLQSWFQDVGSEIAVGERSSLLLTSDVAPNRIDNLLPGVKIIFCLRNPIERAWGNYRFTVLEGLEPLSFEEALEREDERIAAAAGIWAEVQPHAYLSRSRYASHLRQYFEVFGAKRVLLLKSEELGRYPRENLRRVCQFLGVDSSSELSTPPSYSSPSVIDRDVQVQLRGYFGERFPEIVESIRKEKDFSPLEASPEDVLNVKRLQANLRSGKDPVSEGVRRRLRREFADELGDIAGLVDFSIEDWE